MVPVETNSTIPQTLILDTAAQVAKEHMDARPITPATLSAIAAQSMKGIVDLVIDGCISQKGLELQSTFSSEELKPDFTDANVENLAEFANTCCESVVVLKEIFTEIENELLTNPRKLSEASPESLISLVCAFDKANLLSPELAKAVKDEILFKDASKLHNADAKHIALLLGVYSKSERTDRAFFEAIERDLICEHGSKMWKSDAKVLIAISASLREAGYKDRELHAQIHAVALSKMRRA
jgi:hypothetical protein